MVEPRLFLCSGVQVPESDPLHEGRHPVQLNAHGYEANVNIRLEDVAGAFMKYLSPRLIDLLEIAAYVYTADSATKRGKAWLNNDTQEQWARDFLFVIPVRDLHFWSKPEVIRLLSRVLSFLSDDKYTFQFVSLEKAEPVQHYLQFGDEKEWPFYGVERVLMFSGGLDSLAGAVETAAQGQNLVLVSHRSVSVMDSRQRDLFSQLEQTYSSKMIRVPVWVNKEQKFGREHTQRSRSFLFSALGAVVAESVNAEGVRFFENGVVSLNLPVADEVLRARASRTTHPFALGLFTQFYSLLLERNFVIDNPYIYKTKAEVISIIANNGGNHLITNTSSCAHTFFRSKTQWHCGTCSQCIERRIGIIAAGQEAYDYETDYVSDVFTGPRKEGYEVNMAVNYVRHAYELNLMSATEMAARFNLELSRAVKFEQRKTDAMSRLVQLHQRHGQTVVEVVTRRIQEHVQEMVEGRLNPTCMLAMVAGQKHSESSWKQYATRISEVLTCGIPRACENHRPENEPRLQELCDGILVGHDEDLIREFPFMRWSSSATKPDWSAEPLRLWVELKYVRKRRDIRQITEDIAADITKYGDNQNRALFVVYDPDHNIVDDKGFAEPIVQHENMMVTIVR